MIDLKDLHETWSIISKNKYMKTDGQIINFYRAVQHGKAIVIDATSEMLAALTEDDADIVKRINLLFDMKAEAQEKVFGPIVKQALKKRLKLIRWLSGKISDDNVLVVEIGRKKYFSL